MRHINSVLAVLLVVMVSLPADLMAETYNGSLAESHIVSLDQLRVAVSAKSSQRAANIQEIQKLLRHEEVRKRVGAVADLEKIERAVPTIDDATLERLATESRTMNDQIRASGSTKWIVIAAIAVFVTIMIVLCASNENDTCFGG